MNKSTWTRFPHPSKAFDYTAKALATQWSKLHAGDCEPWPTEHSLADRLRAAGATEESDIVARVQDAWRAFHRGDFQLAYDSGRALGLPGFAVAVKAACVYAVYLEKNEARAQSLLWSATELAEDALTRVPKDANAHYLYAFALGRYSQRISIVEALAKGFAPKFERALNQAIKLAPKHADAHIALALFNAELVGKLGSFAAGLTYGARAAKAIEHFKKAVKLNSDAPIVKLEYAHGLRLLNRDEDADEIDALLNAAAHCKPRDAMEALDVERAKELLAEA